MVAANPRIYDIELVEYFFAHTVAPAFVAVLIPATVLVVLFEENAWLGLSLLPFLLAVALSPFLMRKRVDRLGSHRARRPAPARDRTRRNPRSRGRRVRARHSRGDATAMARAWPGGGTR